MTGCRRGVRKGIPGADYCSDLMCYCCVVAEVEAKDVAAVVVEDVAAEDLDVDLQKDVDVDYCCDGNGDANDGRSSDEKRSF